VGLYLNPPQTGGGEGRGKKDQIQALGSSHPEEGMTPITSSRHTKGGREKVSRNAIIYTGGQRSQTPSFFREEGKRKEEEQDSRK